MNIEVEIKVKTDRLDELKIKLSKVGRLVKSIRQIDEYYIPCQRDFFARKPYPIEWLRIRTNPDKVIFEYDRSICKRADGLQEYAEEYETEISNPDEFRNILRFLDFKHITTVDKQREYWDCGDFEVALDVVRGLGSFIEIEAKRDFKDAVTARRGCMKFLEELGMTVREEDLVKSGYPDLLLEANKKTQMR